MIKEISRVRDAFIAFCYKHILKPVFFQMDPEKIHDRMVKTGKILGVTAAGRWLMRVMFYSHSSMLRQKVAGLDFVSPVGLAAGFDKNIELPLVLSNLGFGFAEFGSVTGEYCEGNPKPRLWRLKKSESLLVYYGLKNNGAEKLSRHLKKIKAKALRTKTGKHFIYGVSVAKTNASSTVDRKAGIADYHKAYELMRESADYITVNISCPNAFGGEPFTDKESLELLLSDLDHLYVKGKPVFLKFSPDLGKHIIDELLAVCDRHKVDGYICTNLTKPRSNPKILDENVPEKGGIGGKAVSHLADDLIAYIYRKTKGKKVIIGLGGIFTAEDAYRKIRLGANLVQLITGMIYVGPSAISQINLGLERLLKRDGFKNISEAVGEDVKGVEAK
jgi:dihydroorotate dehydrogenase